MNNPIHSEEIVPKRLRLRPARKVSLGVLESWPISMSTGILGRFNGETVRHADLKMLAQAWASQQGYTFAAQEVSFPHRRFRVDVAACRPERNVPSRRQVASIDTVLRAAAVFECKQARCDLIRDNKQRKETALRLKTLESRRTRLESLLQMHLPHLARGESLSPEFDCYRLAEHRHGGYQRLVRHIAMAKRALLTGTKFDRLMTYKVANLHYLVAEDGLIESHEVPTGWGLLIRLEDHLELLRKPTWQPIGIEDQLVFLQRLAALGSTYAPRRDRRTAAGENQARIGLTGRPAAASVPPA